MLQELLILERVSDRLVPVKDSAGVPSVVLEGTFGEIGVKNKNNRIYTEEQYQPQIESLQKKINDFKLLGELDHPKQFDVALSNASHVIEKLDYNKDTKKITGRIRLLNTPKGLTAQALVKDGIPLHISSRAAGSVNEQGIVTMKKLFTYDLVADPGFENAQLNKVNEKYGFKDDHLFLYEMNSHKNESNAVEDDDKYKKKDIQMEQENNTSNFVTKEDFAKYSEYVKEQLNNRPEPIKTDFDSEKFIAYTNSIVERLNGVSKYVNYLAEQLDSEIDLKNDIVENMQALRKYSNYLAETLNTSINEQQDLGDIVLSMDENLTALDEELTYNTEYTKYLAKETDKGLQYTEKVAERADEGLQYAEYLAGMINENINEALSTKTEVGNIIEHNDYIIEGMEKLATYNSMIGSKVNEMVDSLNEGFGASETSEISENENTEEEETSTSDYKKAINEQLQTLIKSAKKQKAETEDYRFLTLLESKYRNEFMGLNPEKKQEVMGSLKDAGYKTKEDVRVIYESVIHPEIKKLDFVENMPEQIKPLWENLSEEGKKRIEAQAQYHKLDTPYQINNFWQTRDLRSQKVKMEPVNENETPVTTPNPSAVSTPYMENFEHEMKRRFNK